jgi:hypothetical protein
MAKLPYRIDLEQLLIRYAGALEQSDFDVCLLQLWALLEKLTNTVGANYDETIRRTVWPYRDRSAAKESLECVRLRRNRYVHAAKSSDEREQLVYLIKSFIDPHLLYLVRNDFGVATLEEYAAHLALPADPKVLDRQRKQRSRALFLIRKWTRAAGSGAQGVES